MPFETILLDISDAGGLHHLEPPGQAQRVHRAHARGAARGDGPGACDGEVVRALLITGNGRGFCAGQDLSERVMSEDAGNVGRGQRRSRRTTTRWCAGCVSCACR